MEGIIAILILAAMVAIVVVLRLIKSKLGEHIAKHKAPQLAKKWAANSAPRKETPPIKPKPTLPPKLTEGSKPTLFQPEDLEPRDKPIRKTAAKKMYADALQVARPHLSAADIRIFKEGFAGDIETYLGMLEQQSPEIELEDLQNELEMLEFDLYDDPDDELEPEELAENAKTRAAIAVKKAEIAGLKSSTSFYKQKDLRYLLAAELNQIVFRHPMPDHETLIRSAAQKHKAALHSTSSRQ